MTREQEIARVREQRARRRRVERVLDALLPKPRMLGFSTDEPAQPRDAETRQKMRDMLMRGEIDEREIEIEVRALPMGVEIMAPPGMEEMQQQLQSVLSEPRRQPHPHAARQGARGAEAHARGGSQQARQRGGAQERARSPMPSRTASSSSTRSTRSARRQETIGADVSREGVQRDLLPLVEGCTVSTKYGSIKTDHVLFIASGAFHMSKPSDLIPELQGRFPIRVELDSLKVEDFVRILTEPDASLTAQYRALLATEKAAARVHSGRRATDRRDRLSGQRAHREHRCSTPAHGHGTAARSRSPSRPASGAAASCASMPPTSISISVTWRRTRI